MSSILGTVVGAALQNHEAVARVGGPALNAFSNGLKVIWNTFWKSTLLGLGSMVAWVAATITARYASPLTPVLSTPVALVLFAVFLFIILPTVVFIREVVMMNRKVKAQRADQRAVENALRAQRNAQYAAAAAACQNHPQH